MSDSEKKAFILDTMLGELARWLRLLGYDTLYSRVYTDSQILKIAERTGRIVVTRDRGLYIRARKRGLRAVYITGDTIVERLAELAIKVGISLRPDPSRSRCPRCNAPLVVVRDKEKVRGRVPPRSFEAHDVFYVCPRCGMVYWEGSHWKNIRRIAKEAEELARSAGEAGRSRGAHRGRG
ncbi:MAG: Mut7-C RNAse domain-containing protein [Desulfurococcales archaeon]|nr:Mut7-C RNAse domain-containing protein [Desulfurococcales archaeon]